MKIGDQVFRAVLDTGATLSIVARRLLKTFKKTKTVAIRVGDGGIIHSLGGVDVTICLGDETVTQHCRVLDTEAGSDPRGHLGVTWGVYLCAGKPPLADIILSRPPELTRCDSVIGLAIPAMSGHIQNRGAASGDLYIRISGINRVLLS